MVMLSHLEASVLSDAQSCRCQVPGGCDVSRSKAAGLCAGLLCVDGVKAVTPTVLNNSTGASQT